MAIETHRTTCNRDCPDACGIVATVEDGRIVKLARRPRPPGDARLPLLPDQPLPRAAVRPRPGHHAAPPDGAGSRRSSWDDALDLIAEKMLRIKRESGPAAILHYRSGGTLGIMKYVNDRFFERFGPAT